MLSVLLFSQLVIRCVISSHVSRLSWKCSTWCPIQKKSFLGTLWSMFYSLEHNLSTEIASNIMVLVTLWLIQLKLYTHMLEIHVLAWLKYSLYTAKLFHCRLTRFFDVLVFWSKFYEEFVTWSLREKSTRIWLSYSIYHRNWDKNEKKRFGWSHQYLPSYILVENLYAFK